MFEISAAAARVDGNENHIRKHVSQRGGDKECSPQLMCDAVLCHRNIGEHVGPVPNLCPTWLAELFLTANKGGIHAWMLGSSC